MSSDKISDVFVETGCFVRYSVFMFYGKFIRYIADQQPHSSPINVTFLYQ